MKHVGDIIRSENRPDAPTTIDWVNIQDIAERLAFLEGLAVQRNSVTDWVIAATSVFAFLLSAIAVVLLWRTLVATSQAVEQARLANLTAEQSIQSTRELGQAQVRAYLSASRATVTLSESGCKFEVTYTNVGASPARNVAIRGTGVLRPDVTAGSFAPQIVGASNIQWPVDSLPGQELTYKGNGGISEIDKLTLGEIKKNPSMIILNLIFEYKDVFNIDRSDEFELIALAKPRDDFSTPVKMGPPPRI